MMQNKQRLVVPSEYTAIRQVCDFVVQAAAAAGLNEQQVFHVQLAVDEACTNIVEHAYGGSDQGQITITCGTEKVQDQVFFLVRLEDHGEPFDPRTIPTPNLSPDPDELQIGGLGMHFMRQFMDRLEFHFSPEQNELTMYKQLSQGSS